MRRLIVIALLTLTGAATAGPSSAATPVHFKSPSGNINCYVFATDGGLADCLVRQAQWAKTPHKPASCDLDFDPYEVQLGRTAVSIGACRGDVGPRCYTGNGRCVTLAYGKSVLVGTIRCSSAANGITCRRTTSTHRGFRLAREGVVVLT